MQNSITRPYRSKRQRPCDRCRTRKTACILENGVPCQSCFNARRPCTFDTLPTRRRRPGSPQVREPRAREAANVVHEEPGLLSPVPGLSDTHTEQHPGTSTVYGELVVDELEDIGNVSGFMLDPGALAPLVQRIQSLDHLNGFSAQMSGTSGESDPWLLRHGRYDENGMCNISRVSFRTVGGVPYEHMVPVHFLVAENSLYRGGKEETSYDPSINDQTLRHQLDDLVPEHDGRRLISLFLTFVFPLMPAISRSHLKRSLLDPSFDTPVYLLAAIYASSFPFRVHDPSLCVSGAYESPPTDSLWRLVYTSVLREIHTPNLAVLQSALLYLQRFPKHAQSAASDSPFVWSFFGTIANLANTLGLHLNCQRWGIPCWEKRIRRRLWWIVYIEDKWRSLLAGRPPMIQPAEWDVSPIEIMDFDFDNVPNDTVQKDPFQWPLDDGMLFRTLSQLAPVAERLQSTFYSLRSSQRLCKDFRASVDTARAIRQDLQAWYASLPETIRLRQPSNTANYGTSTTGHCKGAAVLNLSYLALEVLLYRAILRPLGQASPPPPIANEEIETGFPEFQLLFENLDVEHLTQLPALETLEFDEAAEVTINAAEKCAGISINFLSRLTSTDFDSFWHSWSRIFFSLVSNFILLLLVQAPTAEHAIRSKQMLDRWTQSLRFGPALFWWSVTQQ
ncbi:fungal-specific transcription factor domain-containing protein [Aspergillus cavernicola]|uniref:Fungal-specific transcription factor domain-containing protein n=1 Tax=Aspergillus cavernicola TaxID=176166 RepID=A0ABR4ICN1_9EURO